MNITSSLASATLLAGHARTTPEAAAVETDARSRRADLAGVAAEKQEEIERLQQELDEAGDAAGGAWEVLGWLFGDDGGVGDTRTDKRHERAAADTYGQMRNDLSQAREERDSLQNMFGTIFGGPLIGTHVGAAVATSEADRRDDPSQHQTQFLYGEAESRSWRDDLTKEP